MAGRSFSRREAAAVMGLLPLAAVGLAASARAEVCYDPNALPLSQRSRRRSLGYKEPAPEPAKRCGGCAFFTGTTTGCGTCKMLTGGVVSAGAVCNSWAKKP